MKSESVKESGQTDNTTPALTILDHDRRQHASRRSVVAALLRCGVVLAVAAAIRLSYHDSVSEDVEADQTAVPVEQVQDWFPTATAVQRSADGITAIFDASNTSIGFAVTTLPSASKVVGYRGPTNVLLLLNPQSTVIGAKLLSSEDTPEHVTAIQQKDNFLKQFEGWILSDPSSHSNVDSVSGATLTSLAIAEGIAVRLGQEKPSLRFPDQFDAADLEALGRDGDWESLKSISSFEATVGDGAARSTLIRTGPLVDSITGYQGPSEILLLIDPAGKTSKVSLRRTFDNQPYAGYLNEDTYFGKVFLNKTLREISKVDLEAEQVEGVSGATMTSLAVAETVIAAAEEFELRQQQTTLTSDRRTVRWGAHDFGTLLVLIFGSTIALSRLRGIRWLRHAWNVVLVAYFGLVTGNLISLAVIFGWAARGIAWQLAPGLAAVVVISFVLSAVTRRNVYCSHLCPHGAFQQLLRRRTKSPQRFRKLLNQLRWVPGVILTIAALTTLLQRNLNLAAWEPFNAYIWYVAGFSSIAWAIGSLVYSWFVPMGYCRHACATGRLIDYLRRSAQSDRFTLADTVALTLAIAGWLRVVN